MQIRNVNIAVKNVVEKSGLSLEMASKRKFLDFEKAFDTLEWPFIRKTVQYFGFGPSLLNWLKVFYCNCQSCILNNGWASNFFVLNRGARH